MKMINEVNPFNFDIEKIGEINELYIENRYPGDLGLLPHGMPTVEQAHIFLDFAKEIEKKIKDSLKE